MARITNLKEVVQSLRANDFPITAKVRQNKPEHNIDIELLSINWKGESDPTDIDYEPSWSIEAKIQDTKLTVFINELYGDIELL